MEIETVIKLLQIQTHVIVAWTGEARYAMLDTGGRVPSHRKPQITQMDTDYIAFRRKVAHRSHR